MAARIGRIDLDILARVPGSEPVVIGTVEVPVTGRIDRTRPGVIAVIPDIRAALRGGMAPPTGPTPPGGAHRG